MTAEIIAFPRKRPFAEWEEMPEHWSTVDRYLYDKLTESGEMTHEQAFAECDWHACMKQRQDENEGDFLLRYARESLVRARGRKKS